MCPDRTVRTGLLWESEAIRRFGLTVEKIWGRVGGARTYTAEERRLSKSPGAAVWLPESSRANHLTGILVIPLRSLIQNALGGLSLLTGPARVFPARGMTPGPGGSLGCLWLTGPWPALEEAAGWGAHTWSREPFPILVLRIPRPPPAGMRGAPLPGLWSLLCSPNLCPFTWQNAPALAGGLPGEIGS